MSTWKPRTLTVLRSCTSLVPRLERQPIHVGACLEVQTVSMTASRINQPIVLYTTRVYAIEPCAGVIVSAVARRSILVGRSKQIGGGGGAAWTAPNFFKGIQRKFFSIQRNFLMTFLKRNQNRIGGARRQNISGGGAPITKSRRRRPQIAGGGAARVAQGSSMQQSNV